MNNSNCCFNCDHMINGSEISCSSFRKKNPEAYDDKGQIKTIQEGILIKVAVRPLCLNWTEQTNYFVKEAIDIQEDFGDWKKTKH